MRDVQTRRARRKSLDLDPERARRHAYLLVKAAGALRVPGSYLEDPLSTEVW